MEQWKDIPCLDNLYMVSNMGRVKAKERTFIRHDGKPITVKEKILKGSKDTKEYLQVEARINSKRNIKLLHRLVAEAFLDKPQNCNQVNHKDGNKLNNAVSNLEWVTCADNIHHAWKNGLNKASCGEEHANHKLSDEAVRYIREHYIPCDRQFGGNALARKFGLKSSFAVLRVAHGEGWKHVS